MKKLPILILFILAFSLNGCIWGGGEPFVEPVSDYEPIILNRTAFENTIALENARAIFKTGKIYVKGQYLFINEPNEGFHIFNNSNPSNPIKTSFIKVPGSTDMSIKNNVLYINTATDLIALETNATYSSFNVTKRVKYIFPKMISPDGFYHQNLQDNEVIINWKLKN